MAVTAAARPATVRPMRTHVWSLVCALRQLPANTAGSAPRTAPRMRVTDADSPVITHTRPTVHDQPGCNQSGPRRRLTGRLISRDGTRSALDHRRSTSHLGP